MLETLERFVAFQSPGTPEKFPIEDPIIVPSVAGLMPAPRALITTVSGALAINLIPLPWPGFTGEIILVPTGAFTGATGGVATATDKPIGLAFTAVVGKPLSLIYLARTGMWYPSYVA